jgi:hypothetical protein
MSGGKGTTFLNLDKGEVPPKFSELSKDSGGWIRPVAAVLFQEMRSNFCLSEHRSFGIVNSVTPNFS